MRLLMIMAIVGAGLLATLPLDVEAGKCHPPRPDNGVSYFSGRTLKDVGWIYGARAVLEEYSPFVALGSRTSAWVMLSKSGGGDGWAQIGWKEYSGGQRRMFVQYTYGTTVIDILRMPVTPINGYTHYDVQHSFGKFVFRANGQWVHEDWAGFTPNHAMAAGETHTLASQMPGGFVDTMAWAAREAYYSGTWRPMGGTQFITDSYWHGQYSGGANALEVWDRQCVY